jgi:anti-sigma factor RsiW
MTKQRKIDDWALAAYADGELSGDAAAEIEALLRDDPEAQLALAELKRQKAALKQAYDPVLAESIPPAIRGVVARPRLGDWRQTLQRVMLIGALAAAVALVVHAVDLRELTNSQAANMVSAVRSAHAVYGSEIRHPVEVAADQRDHLMTWLSKRLGEPVNAPDLVHHGYQLVGGRLLSLGEKPVAYFMYENARKQRMSLYIMTNPEHRNTAFRMEEADGIMTCYWLDGPLGYALAGEMTRAEMEPIAHAVYEALDRT